MFPGREIVEEDGEKCGQDEGPQAEPAPEQFKQMQEGPDQGEEQAQEMYDFDFTLEECSENSEYGDDERCFHIAEEDEIPPLQEVEDSDYESDSEVEFNKMDEVSPCQMAGDISSNEEEEYELYDLDRFEADLLQSEDEEKSDPVTIDPPRRQKPVLMLAEMGLYGVCDDYSDDEFITAKEVDALVREMAAGLSATQNP
ncbi:hypothetical protein K438DRAFT_1752727 [Mycena galopus ATCC 62051]|nr:hypothetical protein K438DRAFT_1752727 [Mycena galopus ATCC 62051]